MIGTNRPPRALIAAASERKLKRGRIGKAGEEWQERLWEIYEHLGPVHYGVGFKRNAASKVTYFVAEQVEDQDEPVPTEDNNAQEAFARLGEFAELVGEAVVHRNVAGEGYLIGKDTDGEETWDVWSTLEYNRAQHPTQRKPDAVDELTDADFVLRMWRPSPAFHELPDSPLRSVQQQCEQLLLLNEQIGSVAMSRLSAGILLVPDELSFARPAEDPPDTGANLDEDPLMSEIIDISVNPIKDGESAARVAPAVIRGASEYIKEIRHMTFGREIDKTFADMREELLRQIAAGLDLPAEILTGLADVNHWTVWGIDESAAKLHVDPDVLGILADITSGYLHPVLEEMGVSDPSRFMIWRDYSDLTSRPLSIDQVMKLNRLGVVSDEYVRGVANIPETPDNIGTGEVKSGRDERERAGPDNVDQGPPDSIVAASPIQLTEFAEIDQTLASQIIEASEAAAHRALERAGAKARAKVRKDRQLTALIDGLDNTVVTQTLGNKRLEQFQLTEDQLIPGGTFDPLAERLRKLISGGQERTRSKLSSILDEEVEFPTEEEDRDFAVSAFIALLFAAVAARLFTSSPTLDPAETGEISDEIATGQMVFQLLTQAGGARVEAFTPDSPRGLALGQNTRAALRDAGYVTEAETWRYGTAPRNTFEPHRALDGVTVTDLESPELRNFSAFPPVSHYFPGDHRGCLCQWVPSVLPLET